MSIKLYLREGEANLLKKIFEGSSVDKVIQEALKLGLEAQSLQIDCVAKEGQWISTKESTDPLAVLYFKSKTQENYLITRKPGEKEYGLFEYRWTP
ncbi:MAG: hypothetical protein KJ646_04950 [Nanoarchaeota archaeon]|nr:hypothetical protein [Nanoarchaeota archaeon]MBU4116533.1 hypothetical protein [Nanoarchaeota archaeon]